MIPKSERIPLNNSKKKKIVRTFLFAKGSSIRRDVNVKLYLAELMFYFVKIE